MLFTRCASALAIGGLVAGCATHAGMKPSSRTPTAGVAPSTVVTGEELGRVAQRGSLMDALARARPAFVRGSRGAMPLVSVDGSPLTERSILRTI